MHNQVYMVIPIIIIYDCVYLSSVTVLYRGVDKLFARPAGPGANVGPRQRLLERVGGARYLRRPEWRCCPHHALFEALRSTV